MNPYVDSPWLRVDMLGHRSLVGKALVTYDAVTGVPVLIRLRIPAVELPGYWTSAGNGLHWQPTATQPEQLRHIPWASVYEVASIPGEEARRILADEAGRYADGPSRPPGWSRPKPVPVVDFGLPNRGGYKIARCPWEEGRSALYHTHHNAWVYVRNRRVVQFGDLDDLDLPPGVADLPGIREPREGDLAVGEAPRPVANLADEIPF